MEKRMQAMQTDGVKVERVRSRREVCDLLGVSASTLARLEASGEFPGRTKIRASGLCRYRTISDP
jgi:predicted DNA-binding transcriptional regulator AlpA